MTPSCQLCMCGHADTEHMRVTKEKYTCTAPGCDCPEYEPMPVTGGPLVPPKEDRVRVLAAALVADLTKAPRWFSRGTQTYAVGAATWERITDRAEELRGALGANDADVRNVPQTSDSDDARFLLGVAEHFWMQARAVREDPTIAPDVRRLLADALSERGRRAGLLAARYFRQTEVAP